MKKLVLFFFLLFISVNVFSQNGFTTYQNSIPAFNLRTSITIDPSGNKWYSSSNRGVYKFDGVNWSVYDTTNSGIASSIVYDIEFDASGNAWCATRKGVSKFDGTTWTNYNKINSGLPSDSTYCIFIQASTVWIGTKQGLAKFDGNTWIVYNTSNSGLIDNYVTALNMNSAGDLWIGTNKGLSVKTSSGWITYNSTNSFMSDSYVSSIYFESSTKAWVGMKDQGLFKFEDNTFTSMSYFFRKKGLLINNVKTVSKGPQGGVLFTGGYNGAIGFLEVFGSEIFFYAFPAGYSCDFHTNDSLSNKYWFVYLTGSSASNRLFSFDFSVFFGMVIVPDDSTRISLDVNDVNAVLLNRGDMHWDLVDAAYEVPKGSGRNAIFNSTLWMGGLDNGGSLHLAAMTYRQTGNDYWPGPLDTINGTADSSALAAYDKIWKLDKWQIDEFRTMFANGNVTSGAYVPAYNIVNWPAQGAGSYTRNMAPFVDVNGDGIYNPMLDGDYPKIKGDQMCYWIFNDNLAHTESGGVPLKVEVHASAYAYSCQDIEDSMKVINYTTFYNFEVYNRSAMDYHDVYLGIFSYHQLGGYIDDYTGSNPAGNYSFEYNGNSYDECLTQVLGYGHSPPILSKVILDGPIAQSNDSLDNNNNGIVDESGERNLMTNYHSWNSGSLTMGDPYYQSLGSRYNYMRSHWLDNSHVTYGGNGYGGSTSFNFMWNGVPGDSAGWNSLSLNNPFVSYRMVTSCGPFSFYSGEKVSFDFAYVFTRDNSTVYDINALYYKNWEDVKRIQRWYAADSFPSCDPPLTTSVKDIKPVLADLNIYPNPSSDLLYVNYKTDSKVITIEIYDVRGQLLKSMKTNSQSTQAISVADLASGLYLLKVNDGKNSKVQRFLKQ